MAVAGFTAALLAVRNTSLAVALALPAWASLLQQVIACFQARRAQTRPSGSPARRPHPEAAASRASGAPQVIGAAIIGLGMAVSGVTVARAAADASDRGVATLYPACAATALQGVPGVRVAAPYFRSGYLAARLYPTGTVFLYGESASLGLQVFADYQRIYAGGPDSLAVLARHHSTAVLTQPGALRDRLAASPQWHEVLADPAGLILFTTAALPPRSC
jgi:hypothetical protein